MCLLLINAASWLYSCAKPSAERQSAPDSAQKAPLATTLPPEAPATRSKPQATHAGTAPAVANDPEEPHEIGLGITPESSEKQTVGSVDISPWFSGEDAYRYFKNRQWKQAADAFDDWTRTHQDDQRLHRAYFLTGVSRLYASQPEAASRHLKKVIGQIPDIESTVHLFLAEASARMNRQSDVIKHTSKIPADFSQRRRADILRARALRRAGKRKAARKVYSNLLVASGTSAALLEEAADVFQGKNIERQAEALRRIVSVAPHSKRAIRAEKRLKSLPKKLRSLRAKELITRVQVLMDSRRYRSAIRSATQARKQSKVGSSTWCEATMLMARALEKSKKSSRATPLYKSAVKRCDKRDTFPQLLYFAGKQALRSASPAAGTTWWRQLVKRYPNSRYADDALLQLAEYESKAGRTQRADQYLMDAVHLLGDMQEKAAWTHFWTRWTRGEYSKAVRSAEQSVKAIGAKQMLRSRGRLVYWLGRALARDGNQVRAAIIYARVLREFPLSWYALLAHERLKRLDPKAAEDATRAARIGHDARSIQEASAGALQTASFKAAVELMKLGLMLQARSELDHGRPETPEADWAASLLYHYADEDTKSYRIARWKRPEHASFWPVEGQVQRWRLANPRPNKYRDWVTAAAKSNALDETLIWAVMQTESAFRPSVVSIADAVGLMQLIEPTGKAMAKRLKVPGKVNKHRLKDPELNIQLGSHFLKRLSNRFSANPALMAAAYNAGPGRPKQWIRRWPQAQIDEFVERIPYRETRRYVKSVVTAWVRYRALYNNQDSSIALDLPSQ